MKQSTRTKITIILAIVIYVILMLSTLTAVTPRGESEPRRLVRDDTGNIYMASDSEDTVMVCRMDAEGNADRYYQCRREARDAELLCGYYEGKVYVSQTWQGEPALEAALGAVQHFSVWETADRGFRCILQGTTENETRFTDIRVDQSGVFLAGTDLQTGSVVIYRYQDEDLLVRRYRTDFVPRTVCFGGNGLYVLSEAGEMYRIGTDSGDRNPTGSRLGEAAVIVTDENGVFWQEAESRDIRYLFFEDGSGIVFRDVGYLVDIAYAPSAGNSAMILREDGENRILIVGQDGQDGHYLDVIGLTLPAMWKNALEPMAMVTLIYAAVGAAFLLITHFLRRKSRLLYKTLTAIAGLSGICLVAMFVILHFHESGSYSGIHFAVIAFAEWLVVMVIAILFLGHIWKNMDIVLQWMDKISKGEYDIESRKAPDDDFGIMWTALERMCRNLSAQKYRYHETTDYLYRYAPKNFEQLFDKENLQEVGVGETRQIFVTMGTISVIDKETLLIGKSQKQYIQYVNRLMDILFSQRDAEQAIFLQDGNNLENIKVVFPGEKESAPVALRYSIECLEGLSAQTGERYDTVPFILLHTARMSCGLAGGSRQVYPYVTSLEMETLGRYVDRLKNCGAKIVVTEETWQFVQAQGRYIGYVVSADRKYTFRLYEIFDACSQSRKLARMKNRERFEQALKLFYSNDLYLARSAFSEVLKECPDDGICGWYVFACDELFNQDEAAEKRYELFGREEFR